MSLRNFGAQIAQRKMKPTSSSPQNRSGSRGGELGSEAAKQGKGLHDGKTKRGTNLTQENQLENAVTMANDILQRPRSERTLSDYRRAARFLDNKTPQQYRDECALFGEPISNSRYRLLKAAYQWSCARAIVESINEAQTLYGEDDLLGAHKEEQEALLAAEELERQEPDYDQLRYRQGKPSAHPAPPGGFSKTKKSKRALLSKLKKIPDWQSSLIKEMPTQHKLSTAILALTGCRPSELEKGIKIDATSDKLIFEIRGSKVTKISGQKKRWLAFDPDVNPIALELFEAVRTTKTWKYTAALGVAQRSFYESHIRAACRAFGTKIGKQLSPYVHRQMFSADLKKEGCDREAIALALGHTSDRTQSYYGMAKQSGGNSRGLEEASASRQIKRTISVGARMKPTGLSPSRG